MPKPSATPTSQRSPWGITVPPAITSSINVCLGFGSGEGTIDHAVPFQCNTRLVIFEGPKPVGISECPNIVCGHGDDSAKLVGDGLGVGAAHIGARHHRPTCAVPVLDESFLRPVLIQCFHEKSNRPGVIRSDSGNSEKVYLSIAGAGTGHHAPCRTVKVLDKCCSKGYGSDGPDIVGRVRGDTKYKTVQGRFVDRSCPGSSVEVLK